MQAIVDNLPESTDETTRNLSIKLRERYPHLASKITLSGVNGFTNSEENDDAIDDFAAGVNARVHGINQLFSVQSTESSDSVKQAILARLTDQDEAVISAIYSYPEQISVIFRNSTDYLDAIAPTFSRRGRKPAIMKSHLDFACNHYALSEDSKIAVFQRLILPCLLPLLPYDSLPREGWETVKASAMGQWDVIAAIDLDAVTEPIKSDKLIERVLPLCRKWYPFIIRGMRMPFLTLNVKQKQWLVPNKKILIRIFC